MLQQNDWNDRRNEFPAILFRLSHRTREKYRSGYRGPDGDYEGDDEQKIIESMRGWWEIAGNDVRALDDDNALGVKYAVAFHQGRTLAVVQIDGWHWVAGLEGDDHHRESVDALLAGRSDRSFDCGRLEDERWRDYEKDGDSKRLRWALDASPAPDEVWEAWVGANGTEIAGMRRDAIVSVWPYSLADDERDLMERVMRILGEAIQTHLVRTSGCQDCTRLRDAARQAADLREEGRPEDSQDPSLWLKVLSHEDNWSWLRFRVPSFRSRNTLFQLRSLRNRWAHFAYQHQVRQGEVDGLGLVTRLLYDIGASSAAVTVDFIRRVLETQVRRRKPAAAV